MLGQGGGAGKEDESCSSVEEEIERVEEAGFYNLGFLWVELFGFKWVLDGPTFNRARSCHRSGPDTA